MRICPILTTLLLLFVAPARAADIDPTSKEYRQQEAALYADLVAKVMGGDTSIDFTALRLAYPYTDDWDPYLARTTQLVTDSFAAMTANDCVTALAKSEAELKIDFTAISIHAIRAECFMRAGNQKQADLASAIGHALGQSLRGNFDGKSTDTAYVVISMREENFLVQAVGLRATSQALVRGKDGHFYDLISGTPAQRDAPASVYFDVTPIFAGQASRAAGGLTPAGPK